MAFWRSKKKAEQESLEDPRQAPANDTSPSTDAPATDAAGPDRPEAEDPATAAGSAGQARPRGAEADTPSGGGLFAKMRGALSKTRQTLNTDIRDLFKSEGRLVDDEFLDELFARLIRTDMGVSCRGDPRRRGHPVAGTRRPNGGSARDDHAANQERC